jgi:outer membrane protein OmpU
MDNIKKIGLSALAGSMVAVSANAIDIAVTGDAVVGYTNQSGNGVGTKASVQHKAFSLDSDLYFNGSGETDNGWTVGIFTAYDTDDSAVSSSQATIGMGSLGTFQFNDVSGSSANAIDDVLPKAYEEVWDIAGTTGAGHAFGADSQSGSVSYMSPSFSLMGADMSFSATYDPAANVAGNELGEVQQQGGSTSATDDASALAYTVKASYEGFTLGAGLEETSKNDNGTALKSDETNTTVYALYTYDALSIGYQTTYKNESNISDGSAKSQDFDTDAWAVAYNVNDQLSVSYAKSKSKKAAISDVVEIEETLDSVQVAYTMGAMTISAAMTDAKDAKHVVADKNEETEIAVSFAF